MRLKSIEMIPEMKEMTPKSYATKMDGKDTKVSTNNMRNKGNDTKFICNQNR